MLEQFHFQQPLWLVAIVPLLVIVWLLSNKTNTTKSWEKVIDANLLPMLLQGKTIHSSSTAKWLLSAAWLITCVALADPVWEKIPRPIFQTNAARVIVLDLSNSMLVNDIKPTRMARARFKVEDILAKEEEGQTGLVVFAGDAFTASPLTRDAETIRALLQVLTPRIMPTQGSRADLGLEKAYELLKQAGVSNGQVLLITDGTSAPDKTHEIASTIRANGHSLSVLAVGTKEGGILRLNQQQQVRVKLDIDSLHKTAEKGGGVLHSLTNSDADLQAVLRPITNTINKKEDENQKKKLDDLNSTDWKSTGPLIILILLPIAALAFRKGWLFNLFISLTLVTAFSHPEAVFAATDNDEIATQSMEPTWKDFFKNLLKNKEQRAEKAFQEEQYDKAQELTKNPLRAGSAAYKKGDYEKALESFKKAKGADARYNEGNALAKLEKYPEAIKAYEEALEQQSDMADAKANKKTLENFLKEQKKQQQQNQQSNENSEENKDQKNQEEGKEGSQQDNKNQDKNKKGEPQKDNDGQQGDTEKQNQFSEANENLDKKANEKDSKENQEGKKSDEENNKNPDKNNSDETAETKNNPDDKNSEEEKPENLSKKGTKAEAEELNKEEKMAAEQWLRRIPDDPGGLLRRKFSRQYKQRKRSNTNENPW